MSDSLRLPCPTCSGTGTDTHEDRHTETNRDTCRTCGGTGQIPARTGESAEASYRALPMFDLGQMSDEQLVSLMCQSQAVISGRARARDAQSAALVVRAQRDVMPTPIANKETDKGGSRG